MELAGVMSLARNGKAGMEILNSSHHATINLKYRGKPLKKGESHNNMFLFHLVYDLIQ